MIYYYISCIDKAESNGMATVLMKCVFGNQSTGFITLCRCISLNMSRLPLESMALELQIVESRLILFARR